MAAIRDGGCFCGNTAGGYGAASASECVKCGNSDFTCGSATHNSVYPVPLAISSLMVVFDSSDTGKCDTFYSKICCIIVGDLGVNPGRGGKRVTHI